MPGTVSRITERQYDRTAAHCLNGSVTPGRRDTPSLVIVVVAIAIGFLPFVKMGLVVNGVFIGAIIALGAIGLTLIYGILNFANVAHGDYMTVGAYTGLFIVASILTRLGIEGSGLGPFTFGYPLLIALPIAVAAVAAMAIVLDALVYRRLRDRGVNVVVVSMASLGVAIGLRGLVQLIWGGEIQRFPRETRQVFHLPMDVRIPPDAIFIAIVAIFLVATVYLVLNRTKMGKAMRATADNPDLALVSGIGTQRVIWWTWVMGAALAATAGILLAVFQANMLPIMGWKFLIPCSPPSSWAESAIPTARWQAHLSSGYRRKFRPNGLTPATSRRWHSP